MPQDIPLLQPITWAPQIDLSLISEDEHQTTQHLASLLAALANYEKKFALAVLLFDWSHAETWATAKLVEEGKTSFASLDSLTDTLSGWKGIAARDGALSIYHFGKTVQAIYKNLKQCPKLNALVEEGELQE